MKKNLVLLLALVALGAPAVLQPDLKGGREDRVPAIALACSKTVIRAFPEKQMTEASKSLEGCSSDMAALAVAIATGVANPNARPDHR